MTNVGCVVALIESRRLIWSRSRSRLRRKFRDRTVVVRNLILQEFWRDRNGSTRLRIRGYWEPKTCWHDGHFALWPACSTFARNRFPHSQVYAIAIDLSRHGTRIRHPW